MKRFPPVSIVVALVALAAVIGGLVVLLGHHSDPQESTESPSGSVRRFLTAAGSGDGDTACGYLSISETSQVERAAGPDVACSEAFLDAQLDLGGRNYLEDLARVRFSTSWDGTSPRVVATNGNASTQFTLAPATPTEIEQQSYQPPPSNWRITSGATTVVRSVP